MQETIFVRKKLDTANWVRIRESGVRIRPRPLVEYLPLVVRHPDPRQWMTDVGRRNRNHQANDGSPRRTPFSPRNEGNSEDSAAETIN
jgi:hypothetical protein